MESPPTGTKFAIHAGAPFERFSVCVQGRGRGTGEAGEPLQTADGGTTLAGFKYLRGAAPLLDSYGLTWKTTGPDDLVPTPRPTPKVVLVRPLYPRFVIFRVIGKPPSLFPFVVQFYANTRNAHS